MNKCRCYLSNANLVICMCYPPDENGSVVEMMLRWNLAIEEARVFWHDVRLTTKYIQ